MWRSFRTKLLITMAIFAAVIAFTIAVINHVRISEQAVENNRFRVEEIETTVEYSLSTIEKVYYHLGMDVAKDMRAQTLNLLKLYRENPEIKTWDLQALKREIGMDIFLIDEQNVIQYSTKESDIGMNFNQCCGKLAKILDERRRSGDFYHDGMDISQATGEVTKYSYMATPDKKYIVELGYSLHEGVIFHDFNFLTVIEELEMSYPSINDINILNIGGLALGNSPGESKLSPERRKAFEETLEKGKPTEVRVEEDGDQVIYRYVPYQSTLDFGSTQHKAIEIAYNERELQEILQKHKYMFFLQIAFILMITVIIALIISKWVAKPMYMAFHDSLTGLRNRAAFEEDLHKALRESEGETGLLMIDLDQFKLVNDLHGHSEGDRLLKKMAETIQSTVSPEHTAYRLGGDEFGIIFVDTSYEYAVSMAQQIIDALNKKVTIPYQNLGIQLTASIGIALSEKNTGYFDLYNQADQALYESKERGKNQYHVF